MRALGALVGEGTCRLLAAPFGAEQCAMCEGTSAIDCTGTNTAQIADCDITVGEFEAASRRWACAAELQSKCGPLFGGATPGDGGL